VNLGWRTVPFAELVKRVRERADPGRLCVVAVNGHSSSGKTTLAGRLADDLPDAAVLHTDDLDRDEGVFAWDVPLRDRVLPVVRAGEPLDHPAPRWWQARGLTGSVTLPGSLAYLLVEGVGASQASVRDTYDFVIWVETEEPTRSARDQVRLAAGEMPEPGAFERWMAEENAYTTRERPWKHADLLVYGGQSIAYDRRTEVVLSNPEPAGSADQA
jgi:uridine kinase